MVRNIMMELINHPIIYQYENTAVAEYLYLPVQLFIALSGSYDPIVSPESGTIPEKEIFSARGALRQEMWEERGISGSSDYLKWIFGLSGSEGGMKMDASKGKGKGGADTD
jgi:hypothetical protein